MTWRATVLTLVPEAFPGPLGVSVIGHALEKGLWALNLLDIRDYARDKHRSVDDTPAGGGPGMVIKPDVAAAALDAAWTNDERVGGALRPAFLMSPRGRRLTQKRVRELADGPGAVILAGRFEGVDQRVVEARGLEEVSVGDVVTAGGEAPAMTMIEACVRLLPGVLGAQASTVEESFEGGLLEHPHFTRPRAWEGRDIPDVLLSGDHGAVARWRREQAEKTTKERRPDLWASYLETNDERD